MLFDVFGDFATVGERPGHVSLATLVRLGTDLGIREAAIRAAAHRTVQNGWFLAHRRGRETVYRLSRRGQQLVDDGRRRIFGPAADRRAWDGTWSLITLSVPEARREVRDGLRKQLAWLGFGSPSPGVYLSPWSADDHVEQLAEEFGAGDYLQVYTASVRRPANARSLVARAWPDLESIDRRYAEFVERFSELPPITEDRDAFRMRFALVNRFRACLFGDPELPTDLLPPDWSGAQARALFETHHARLTAHALRYFDSLTA